MPLDDKIPVRSLFLPDKNTVRGEMKRPWEDLWQRMGRRELAVLTLDFMDANDKARVGGAERGSFINRPPLDPPAFPPPAATPFTAPSSATSPANWAAAIRRRMPTRC